MAPLTPHASRPIKLLLVEGERDGADGLGDVLEQAADGRVDIESASELGEALKRLSLGGIDVVLLELSLPDSEGMVTFERMYAFAPDVPIVVLTDEYDEELGVNTVQAGAQDYLVRQEAQPAVVFRTVRYAMERHRLQAGLRSLALMDDLTGLYNSRGFTDLGEQHLELARRSQRGITLVFLDLDHLQTINDSLGHHVGDRALRRVADLLRATFRRSDIIARMGGDEFAVLAIEASDQHSALIVSRLRETFADFDGTNREPYQLSVSMGVARNPAAGRSTLEELLAEAESAMREEKRAKLKGVIS